MFGPFRTKRAARFLANHPQCKTVADAEKLAKTHRPEDEPERPF